MGLGRAGSEAWWRLCAAHGATRGATQRGGAGRRRESGGGAFARAGSPVP